MISVVIPAHNEALVIGSLLDRLDARASAGDIEVVVVANGCSDDTADVARRHHATVLELAEGSKPAALRAGDQASGSFPRFYVDADVEIDGDDLIVMASGLSADHPAVAPGLRLDMSRCSRMVAAYHRIWLELPSVRRSLAGRGCFGLTESGRSRWAAWPDLTADDQFANRQFSDEEKTIHDTVSTLVRPPATVRGLLNRKRRSHRGNTDLEADGQSEVTSSTAWVGVIRRQPGLIRFAPVYVTLTVVARVLARIDSIRGNQEWRSDDSRGWR